jgi:hypothetical protein
LKVEQCLVQATSESISRNIVNMLGPNESVYVIIQESAYFAIIGRQDELDEPGVIGKDGIAEPEDVIIRAALFRENGDENTRLS